MPQFFFSAANSVFRLFLGGDIRDNGKGSLAAAVPPRQNLG
jgi:hypothetical protein